MTVAAHPPVPVLLTLHHTLVIVVAALLSPRERRPTAGSVARSRHAVRRRTGTGSGVAHDAAAAAARNTRRMKLVTTARPTIVDVETARTCR